MITHTTFILNNSQMDIIKEYAYVWTTPKRNVVSPSSNNSNPLLEQDYFFINKFIMLYKFKKKLTE